MKNYIVNATKSEETKDNYIQFYKENNRIWISIGTMEERGFTIEEVEKIINDLRNCIRE